jgi:hypothetical protein
MPANVGEKEVMKPLQYVWAQSLTGFRVRQLFVLTDAEVKHTDQVLAPARNNAPATRSCTIGIGRGADAGLVERLAQATGGRADFVGMNDDLTGTVIAQLQVSLGPSLTHV